MNKKAFTLIEIIVSISLIAIFALIAVIGFNNNRADDKKDKIISDLVSAADVYYSMNTELLKKTKENDGYLVLTINSLKELGIINEFQELPTLSDEEINENLSYEKILIKYDVNENSELESIEYIYPYLPNIPYTFGINDLILEYEEARKFKCKYDTNNKNVEFNYMNENYEKTILEDYSCSVNGSSYDKDEEIDLTSLLSNGGINKENVTLSYKSNTLNKERKITILPKVDKEKLKFYVNNSICDDNTIWISGNNTQAEWKYNGNAMTSLSDIHRFLYNYINPLNEVIENGHSIYTLSKNISEQGNYKFKIILNGYVSNSEILSKTVTCEINFDNNSPLIKLNNLDISMKDSESGLKRYYIKGYNNDINLEEIKEGLTNSSWTNVNSEQKNELIIKNILKFEDYKYYVIFAEDNAGNVSSRVVSKEDIPSINLSAVDGSVSKFKVEAYAKEEIDSVKVQYTFDDLYYASNSEWSKYSEDSDRAGDVSIARAYSNFLDSYSYNANSKNNIVTDTFNSDSNRGQFLDENNYQLELDMADVIYTCYNDYNCKRIIRYSKLFDEFNINYFVKLTTSDGQVLEKKFKVTLNVDFLVDLGQANDYYTLSMYLNSNGDILVDSKYRHSGYASKNEYSIYVNKDMNVKDIATVYLGSNYLLSKDTEITSYTTSNVEIQHCETDDSRYYLSSGFDIGKNIKTYTYDIKSNILNTKISKIRWNKLTYRTMKCNLTSSAKSDTSSFVKMDFKNNTSHIFLNNLLSYGNKWEKANVSKYTSTYTLNNKFDFSIIPMKDGKTYGVLVKEDGYANSDSASSDYDEYYLLGYNNKVSIMEIK